MAVKIIHCADIHFDTPFTGLDSTQKAEIRREELRQTFGKIVSLAAEEKADALIICGDMFDSRSVSAHTLRYVREKLASIPNIPVFISAGNHDPNTPGSYYQVFNWSANVHIFPNHMERFECEYFDIYGQSFSSFTEEKSMLTDFQIKNADKVNIIALHGDINGVYNPITEREIEQSGADYLALGHIHSYSGAMYYGQTCAVYPGCPEGRGYDELGKKGVVIAKIEKGQSKLTFVPLCRRQYHEIVVSVNEIHDYETLCGRILLAMNGSEEDLYKIILTGTSEFTIQPAIILENLKCFSAKIKNQTSTRLDYDKIKNELTLKGLFIKNVFENKEITSDTAELVLSIGLDVLRGEKVKLP